MQMKILSNYRILGDCHVSPSPDGSKVVLDSLQHEKLSILLYDYKIGKMRALCTQPRDLNVEKTDKNRLRRWTHGLKHYDVNAHPAFSRDSRRIIFNSCRSQVRLCEIVL